MDIVFFTDHQDFNKFFTCLLDLFLLINISFIIDVFYIHLCFRRNEFIANVNMDIDFN